ncbi:MAG: hypothetical protein GC134_10015 [Proteobacteria bacterium]|nr:hypothetical protein [Pseudomonadota bacterium]
MPFFWPLVFAVLGSVFGSFITCALYRVPRGLSLRQPPSMCPDCGTRLGVPDLVPVFSWLFLRGKCRHCGMKVSVYYLGVELLCVGCGLAAFAMGGPALGTFLLFVGLLCAVSTGFLWVQACQFAPRTAVTGSICCMLWVLMHC